jgi:hypothetical protein
MDWEEALLRCWGVKSASESALRYRQRTTRSRELAEETTTRALKARLLDDAAVLDQFDDGIEQHH